MGPEGLRILRAESGPAMTIEVEDPGPRTPLQRGEKDEGLAMSSLVLELQAEFPSVPADQVSVLVQCLWSHYDSAPVRDFVVLLVREAGEGGAVRPPRAARGGDGAGAIVPAVTSTMGLVAHPCGREPGLTSYE